MKRPARSRRAALLPTVLAACVALVLGGCGGGGGDGAGVEPAAGAVPGSPATASGGDVVDALLVVGDSGRPASDASVDALRRTAAEHAVRGVVTNLDALGRIGRDAGSLTERMTAFAGDGEARVFDDGAPSARRATAWFDDIDAAGADAGAGAGALLRALLGLDGAAARITRDGDTLVIDPDDEMLCAAGEDAPLDASGARVCRELASRLAVRLDALSADSGWLSLDVDGDEALRLGYGPVNSVLEVELGAIAALARAGAELAGDVEAVPPRMSGRLRLTLGAVSRARGAERAAMALDVLTPLSISDDRGLDVALAASRVFELVTDAAAGRLTLDVALGALGVVVPNAFTDALDGFGMAGLTARAVLDTDGQTLVVSDLGIGRGPMTWTLDGAEVARLDLGAVGFRLDGAGGRLSLHGDLSAAYVMRQVVEGATYAASARLSAPGGTVVEEREDGFRVAAGGVEAGVSLATPDETFEEALSVTAGQCAAADPADYVSLLPVVVPCR